MNYQLQPIGYIRTPHQTIDTCPRNIEEEGPVCQIIIDESYTDGLYGLAPGDRVVLLYWLDQAALTSLRLPSRKTGEIKGIFALRTPHRPNPIGLAKVVIDEINSAGFTVRGLDCLDKTPLLDIKPAMTNKPCE